MAIVIVSSASSLGDISWLVAWIGHGVYRSESEPRNCLRLSGHGSLSLEALLTRNCCREIIIKKKPACADLASLMNLKSDETQLFSGCNSFNYPECLPQLGIVLRRRLRPKGDLKQK